MFDIGFWELAIIGVIALLVVGPERLPALARNVGMWVGRIRRYVSHVKQDIERELHAEEVRELLEKRDGLSEIRDVARETASALNDARREIGGAAREIENTTRTSTSTRSDASPPPGPGAEDAAGEQPDAPSLTAPVPPPGGAAESEPADRGHPGPSEPPEPSDEHQPERQRQR